MHINFSNGPQKLKKEVLFVEVNFVLYNITIVIIIGDQYTDQELLQEQCIRRQTKEEVRDMVGLLF